MFRAKMLRALIEGMEVKDNRGITLSDTEKETVTELGN